MDAKEYIPFGEEWKNELMNMPKISIIALYRQLALTHIKMMSSQAIPTEHESQAMRDYKNTRGSVHYHHGWTACYNWIKEYINKG